MTLREISGELMELKNLLDGDEEDDQVIKGTIDSVMFDFEEKADGYGTVIQELKADTTLLSDEIKRLQKKKKTIENNIERLKWAIRECMETAGEKKINGKMFSFSIRNNGAQLPEFIPTDKIPAEFWENPAPTIKRKELLKAVKDGDVEGIDLVRTKSLQMR